MLSGPAALELAATLGPWVEGEEKGEEKGEELAATLGPWVASRVPELSVLSLTASFPLGSVLLGMRCVSMAMY